MGDDDTGLGRAGSSCSEIRGQARQAGGYLVFTTTQRYIRRSTRCIRSSPTLRAVRHMNLVMRATLEQHRRDPMPWPHCFPGLVMSRYHSWLQTAHSIRVEKPGDAACRCLPSVDEA